jgi:CRISPR-associated protein Cas1
MDEHDPLISVAALHALVYCERLFYLEEVERIRVADAAVFAGRRLHVELAADEADGGSVDRLEFESATLGLRGAVDVLRRRDGHFIPYEHKRGRSAGQRGHREAWRTDRVQVGAYALLVEEAYGQPVPEGRVRYHADGVTVRVPIDAGLREEVRRALARAGALRQSVERPQVTDNERLCTRCSLAPVCLPEEARLGSDAEVRPLRLLPPHPDRQVVHVIEPGTHVGRAGHELVIRPREGEGAEVRVPIAEVGQVVLHGFAQISTQALRLCASEDVGVHWMTQGGGLVGSLAPAAASAQRHLRQFTALSQPEQALGLARRLVHAKVEGQLRFLLRATRGEGREATVEQSVTTMREMLRKIDDVEDAAALLGIEGNAAAAYFAAVPALLSPDLDERLCFAGRTRQPPRDRVNALLGYGYGMLYREVLQSIVAVGLHPGMGFYHRPRSAAHPLALDLMELFRVPLIDMAMIGALNRKTFDAAADFVESPGRVLLNETGRQKAIEVVERRKADEWKHSVVGYSLSYARMIELEVRLLEKEWMGEGGLFARFRLR